MTAYNIAIGIVSGLVSYTISVVTTAIIVGVKWGKVTNDIENMKSDLSEIKGMFILRLKD